MSLVYPYGLSNKELEISDAASKKLGFKVLVYKDGNWMCHAVFLKKDKIGFGETPEEAIQDYRKNNESTKSL